MSTIKTKSKGMNARWSHFLGWTILLGALRGLDFYSTSLWFLRPDGYLDETNPLVAWFGIGANWELLWMVNVLLVLLILGVYWFYCFRYRPKFKLNAIPGSPLDLVKWQYFGRSVPTWQLVLRPPKHLWPGLAHLGFVGIRCLAIGSLLAGIHNLGQFYQWSTYASFRELVNRPTWVIYFLVVLSVFFYYRKAIKLDFDLVCKNACS